MAYTKTQVDDMIARGLTPFKQSVIGDNSIAITANTEARFVCDGDTYNFADGPSYMTDRWDTTNSKMAAITEYDSPTYVADMNFIWTPSASNTGSFILRVYIDDDTPKLIRTYEGAYKGAGATPKGIIATWYWGTDTGYDAKNDGIYFTLEFEHNGTVTVPTLNLYNTQ